MHHARALAAAFTLVTTALVAGTALAAPPSAAKPAPKGVKCGDSYIAAGAVCHKAPPPKTAGKKCGASYIAANAVCRK